MRKRMSLKGEHINSTIAETAVDLAPYLNNVRDATTIEQKKLCAHEMAKHFAVGGRDKFCKAVDAALTVSKVDEICFYATLKGEGMGAKLY